MPCSAPNSPDYSIHDFDAYTAKNIHIPPAPPDTFRFEVPDHGVAIFEVWQQKAIIGRKQPKSLSSHSFLINICTYDCRRETHQSRRDGSTYTEEYRVRGSEFRDTYWEPYLSDSDEDVQSIIHGAFGQTRIPGGVVAAAAPRLLRFARSVKPMICRDCGHAVRPFSIVVQMVAVDFYARIRFSPAEKSSIEALEKAKAEADGSGVMENCRICLEEISAGVEVARMPCSHAFHGNCIVRWLKTSHLCPLCRFEMPHDSSSS